ncbi:(2Fe-2S)-binding protein [Candidatus Endobugula sertula]|uniref:(2Fe-2S)-binding protein n=1 Tax=Candidatus Endobugula sertula TaxID=62101 RepID=A0A1D2QT16_9GAMM|nr:(2Fe-2S)-binding protein [Candidatus Endobugula sertula]
MALIFFVTHDGNMYEVEAAPGETVMQAAIDNGIDGILGECGGCQSCATCHCYIDDIDKTGVAEGTEFEMIANTSDPRANSRLSCQIVVTKELDGLTVHLPKSQY